MDTDNRAFTGTTSSPKILSGNLWRTTALGIGPNAFGFCPSAFPIAFGRYAVYCAGKVGRMSEISAVRRSRESMEWIAGLFRREIAAGADVSYDLFLSAIMQKNFGSPDDGEEINLPQLTAVFTQFCLTVGIIRAGAEALSDTDFAGTLTELIEESRQKLSIALNEKTAVQYFCDCTGRERDVSAGTNGETTDGDNVGNLPGPEVDVCVVHLKENGDGHNAVSFFMSHSDVDAFVIDADGCSPIEFYRESTVPGPGGNRKDDRSEKPFGLRTYRISVETVQPFSIAVFDRSADGYRASGRSDSYGNEDGATDAVRKTLSLEENILTVICRSRGVADWASASVDRLADVKVPALYTACGYINSFSADSGDTLWTFMKNCQVRLQYLNGQKAFYPESDDGDFKQYVTDPLDDETECARSFFNNVPHRLDEVRDALGLMTAKRLNEIKAADGTGWDYAESDDSLPVYTELPSNMTNRDVARIFRLADTDNLPDRALIAGYRDGMTEVLREHWVTLREPLSRVFADLFKEDGNPLTDEGGENGMQYRLLLEMNRAISRIKTKRAGRLCDIRQFFESSLTQLDGMEQTYLGFERGEDRAKEWLACIETKSAELVRRAFDDWSTDTVCYQSLRCAYVSERDRLFLMDTRAGGPLSAIRDAMLSGKLDAKRERTLFETVASLGADCRALAERLISVERQIKTVQDRIDFRNAEGQCVRAIESDRLWQTALLRASVFETETWDADCRVALTDYERKMYMDYLNQRAQLRKISQKKAEFLRAYREHTSRYYARLFIPV